MDRLADTFSQRVPDVLLNKQGIDRQEGVS